MKKDSAKLWAGRFEQSTEKIVEEFNASITFDQRMILFDIQGSLAHVKMLAKQGIISSKEGKAIHDGLTTIIDEVKNGKFEFKISDEDVHMAVEARLTELVGSVGGKLHTARSRNDQVALDFKLYLKSAIKDIIGSIFNVLRTVHFQASENIDVIMPGYTHLQTAQPILFSHYIMAYFQMLHRDMQRFHDLYERMDYSPLGSGALAGTTFNIDRHFTSTELGFKGPTENSIDSVSDRDFAIEFLSAASICIMHLSRFCEELIIYSTSEFAFIELSDGFCTGSSIMPQKKNPDIPELIRGKTGRVYGNLMSLLTTMKGLPLAYNKDMQEDKEGVFDTIDTLYKSLQIFDTMLSRITLNKENMYAAASKGYSTATDLADYLVRKGLPFREAHHVVGQAVNYAIKMNKMLQELTVDEFKQFNSLIDEDVYAAISVEASINNKKSYGGTGTDAVKTQLKNAEAALKKYE